MGVAKRDNQGAEVLLGSEGGRATTRKKNWRSEEGEVNVF